MLGFAKMIEGIYSAHDLSTPGSFKWLYVAALLWGTGMWLERDNRRYRIDWMFDMGMYLYVAWPIVMPIYLIKTRGSKAYKPILFVVLTFVFGSTIGLFIGTIFS